MMNDSASISPQQYLARILFILLMVNLRQLAAEKNEIYCASEASPVKAGINAIAGKVVQIS